MTLTLTEAQFVGNKLVVVYNTRMRATFTIINEQIPGLNTLGVLDLITVVVEKFSTAGEVLFSAIYTPIIGVGNQFVQVTADNQELLGKQLNHTNMTRCTVVLVET